MRKLNVVHFLLSVIRSKKNLTCLVFNYHANGPRQEGDIGLFIALVPKIFLIHWLNNFGKWILIGWLIKFSVQTFQPLIVNYRRGNFVYHHWVCTLIYRLLSYPLRSLQYTYPYIYS